MTEFRIEHEWLSDKRGRDEATLARILIKVADVVATKFDSDHGERGDALEIPAYYLAEWLAGNWWNLLWEPRKSDDEGDTRSYAARHNIVASQHGFALPSLQIIPAGEAFYLDLRPRHSELADVSFPSSLRLWAPRSHVEQEIKNFIDTVVGRLIEKGIQSELQEEWSLVTATTEEESLYCKCVGALGLSPYDDNAEIDEFLLDASKFLNEELILDLCQASLPETLEHSLKKAKISRAIMNKVEASDLSSLSFSPPKDDFTSPAWVLGQSAARAVRSRMGIDELDPLSGRSFLKGIGVNIKRRFEVSDIEVETAPVLGAVEKDTDSARIALLQSREPQRLFSALRAVYLGWADPKKRSQHLLTSAATRQQQASRAFAAEMTAPTAYLKNALRSNRNPTLSEIADIAAKLGIGDGVVWKQAENKGLIAARH